MTIKNITGKVIEVTGIYAAIQQCEMYKTALLKPHPVIPGRPRLYMVAVKITENQINNE